MYQQNLLAKHIYTKQKKGKSSITNPTLVADIDGVGGSCYWPKLKEKKSKTPANLNHKQIPLIKTNKKNTKN